MNGPKSGTWTGEKTVNFVAIASNNDLKRKDFFN
jgi:hypothetical protein